MITTMNFISRITRREIVLRDKLDSIILKMEHMLAETAGDGSIFKFASWPVLSIYILIS